MDYRQTEKRHGHPRRGGGGRRRAGNAHRRSGGNHRGGLFGVGPAPSGQGCLCLENRHWPRLPAFPRTASAPPCSGYLCGTAYGLWTAGWLAPRPPCSGQPWICPCDCSVQITASHHPYHRNGPKILHPPGRAGRPGHHGNPGPGPRGAPARSGRLPAPCAPCGYMKGLRRPAAAHHPRGGAGPGLRPSPGGAAHCGGRRQRRRRLLRLGRAGAPGGGHLRQPVFRARRHVPQPHPQPGERDGHGLHLPGGKGPLARTWASSSTPTWTGAPPWTARGRKSTATAWWPWPPPSPWRATPAGTVVTDSITSDGLKEYIETTLGGQHHRFKRGGTRTSSTRRCASTRRASTAPWPLRPAAHAAMRGEPLPGRRRLSGDENPHQDGLPAQGGQGPDQPAGPPCGSRWKPPRSACPSPRRISGPAGEALIAALEAYAQEQNWAIAPDNREGIRVSFPKGEGEGWFLLRLSVHDPILPINLGKATAPGAWPSSGRSCSSSWRHTKRAWTSPPWRTF